MLNLKNITYYFTYANNKNFPFIDGWTEIEAPSKDVAIQLFNYLHPNIKHPDILKIQYKHGTCMLGTLRNFYQEIRMLTILSLLFLLLLYINRDKK